MASHQSNWQYCMIKYMRTILSISNDNDFIWIVQRMVARSDLHKRWSYEFGWETNVPVYICVCACEGMTIMMMSTSSVYLKFGLGEIVIFMHACKFLSRCENVNHRELLVLERQLSITTSNRWEAICDLPVPSDTLDVILLDAWCSIAKISQWIPEWYQYFSRTIGINVQIEMSSFSFAKHPICTDFQFFFFLINE